MSNDFIATGSYRSEKKCDEAGDIYNIMHSYGLPGVHTPVPFGYASIDRLHINVTFIHLYTGYLVVFDVIYRVCVGWL